MAKIFISLSGRDKAWGDWIAWELQRAGHEPIYQHWHFQTGQNIVLRMQEALRTAERVLVIVSGNYVDHESDYTLREMTQAVYQDMAGRDGRVVPVLVERCDLKGSFLGPLARINLAGINDEAVARRSLLDGLEKKGPPLTAPPFPGAFTAPAEPKPAFPGAEPDRPTSEPETTSAPPPLGRLHGDVPTLPGGYVQRRGELDRLRRAVLENAGAVAVTGKGAGVGVQGMGGIGKTLLAAALVRDEAVRRAFPDGIFWITLGQHANAVAAQTRLAALLGDAAPGFADVQDGRARLNGLLADKRALVVVDDVWSVPDAAAFTLRDTASRLLVTTRSLEVVRGLDAAEHRVGELEPDEARSVLARFAGLASADALPPEADGIVRETGRLPLALAMVGATAGQLAGSWGDLLDALRNADLAEIAATLPGYPYPDLLRALQVSIDALDEDERRRYLDLAVLPEDAAVPLDVLGMVWAGENLSGLRLRRLADGLVARALARWDEAGRLTLHDLQRDYLRAKADDLPALHRRLLAAYRARCPDGWWSGRDDGYFFQHLPWHLAGAREEMGLRDLLFDDRWLRAKLAATSVTEAIADYSLLPADGQAADLAAALRLSAHVLAVDPSQLAGQLCGRLAPEDGPAIARLLADARAHAGPPPPALLPRRATLTPPGTPLIRTFTGHTGGVKAVAVLADGRRALSGSYDNTLRLWDLASGAELRRFAGHTSWVNAVVALPDGRRALSGSYDNTLRLWDLEGGAELRRFAGHISGVRAVAALSDGRRALSGSYDDGTLRLWDLEGGAELRRFAGHTSGVRAVAILPDGRRALSGSSDGTLRLWDLEGGAELRRFEGHTDWVHAVVALSDGRRALSGSADRTLRLWDLEGGAELRRFAGHTSGVGVVAALSDGRRALSGSADRTLRLWDLESGAQLAVFTGDAPITCLAPTRDGRSVVAGDKAGNLHLLDILIEPPAS